MGLFWRRGTKAAALSSMTVGFLVAAVLTYLYPDDIAGLGSLTSGVVALAVNLVVYLAVSLAAPQSDSERRRADELFAAGRSHRTPTAATAAEH